MREKRPENTLTSREFPVAWVEFLPRWPVRWRTNLPGTLMEMLPARSRKSMPASMQ